MSDTQKDDPKSSIASGNAYSDGEYGYSRSAKSPDEFVKRRGEEVAMDMSATAIEHGGFTKYKPQVGRADKHQSNIPNK